MTTGAGVALGVAAIICTLLWLHFLDHVWTTVGKNMWDHDLRPTLRELRVWLSKQSKNRSQGV